MTDIKSRRFSIQISSDNHCLQSVYDHMAGSKKGLRAKVLEACESYYYPLSLLNNVDTEPDEILDAAISAVNQLHQQIQIIVEKVQQHGIQPTPLMLAKAGISEVMMSLGSPVDPIPPNPVLSITSSPQIITDNDNDDDGWGDDPPISDARLAYIRDSQKEMGVEY